MKKGLGAKVPLCPGSAAAAGTCDEGGRALNAADVSFDKRGCDKALRRWPDLRVRVAAAVETQAQAGFFHCKGAGRWWGRALKECRVNSRDAGSVRIAFSVEGGRATVVYITQTLVRRDFLRELDRFLGEARP